MQPLNQMEKDKKDHRTLYMPRHPKFIKGGWQVAREMEYEPKVLTLKSGGKDLVFTFPDEFIWCKIHLGPIKQIHG